MISSRQQFPTFTYGYASLYSDDLPLFISADSILYAVHRSYDELLKQIEIARFGPRWRRYWPACAKRSASGAVDALGADTAADLDLYLAVALRAARPRCRGGGGGRVAVRDQGDRGQGQRRATGPTELSLFGVPRTEDFSQFKPRGHYTDRAELTSYFKAMMWLGRIDFRLHRDAVGRHARCSTAGSSMARWAWPRW